MSTTYAEKLRHPLWQRKRLEVLERFNFACFRCCGCDQREIHVHHKQYLKGREPWDYPDENFEALCNDCHSMVHVQQAAIDGLRAALPSSDYDMVIRILKTVKSVGRRDTATISSIVQDELDLRLDLQRGAGGE